MNSVQCKMARAAIGWGVRELAASANVSVDTVSRLERGDALLPRTVSAIRSALEEAGVVFLADGEVVSGGPGVRLREGEHRTTVDWFGQVTGKTLREQMDLHEVTTEELAARSGVKLATIERHLESPHKAITLVDTIHKLMSFFESLPHRHRK